MQQHSFKRLASLVASAGATMLVGVVVFQLGVAFGWTSPGGNPPSGAGALGVTNGQVFIGPPGTAASGTAALTVNGGVTVMNNVISDVITPIGSNDAANKAYVDAQTGGGPGGGSLVVYYRTKGGVPQGGPVPTCPSGWTQTMQGYGPHYLAVVAYDWLQGGTGGTGGGFGGTAPYPDPPMPPPNFGDSGAALPNQQSYVVSDIAIGSDSVCSVSQQTVVHGFQFYLNASSGNFFTYSDACNSMIGPQRECNECIVCHK